MMAFPTIPLPDVWDVPVMAGVPALLGQSIGNGVSASVSNLLGQEVANIQITEAQKSWGIFRNNKAVLTAAHVLEIEHEARYQVSTAPTEEGNFVSYNKSKFPSLTRIAMVCDGSESGTTISGGFENGLTAGFKQVLGSITGAAPLQVRKSFFDTLEQIVADTNLYEIHMPERFYLNANIVAYRFRRSEREGVTMPVVEIELQEIRSTTTNSYRDTSSQTVSASPTVQAGQQQVTETPASMTDAIAGLTA